VEVIESILGDSYHFWSRHACSNLEIALAFVSFCLLLHWDPIVVKFSTDDEIYPTHRVGLHEELLNFSLLDPLLWVEEVDELTIRSGCSIQWLYGQYHDLLHYAQNVQSLLSAGQLDHRLLPEVHIDEAMFLVHSSTEK
ncbi:hypothetical protein KI387_023325, partial [Taxus chinensis]